MGVPEEEIVVTGTVTERDGDRVVIATEAIQAGNGIVRNAVAELDLPDPGGPRPARAGRNLESRRAQ